MRYVYTGLIIIAIGIVAVFILQNPRLATVSFLSAKITLPLSLILLLTYIWGMLTGGIVISLLRMLLKGAAK